MKYQSQFKELSLLKALENMYLRLSILSEIPVSAGTWELRGQVQLTKFCWGCYWTGCLGWWYMHFFLKYIFFFLLVKTTSIWNTPRGMKSQTCGMSVMEIKWPPRDPANATVENKHVMLSRLAVYSNFWDDRQSLSKTTARGTALRRLKSRVF